MSDDQAAAVKLQQSMEFIMRCVRLKFLILYKNKRAKLSNTHDTLMYLVKYVAVLGQKPTIINECVINGLFHKQNLVTITYGE